MTTQPHRVRAASSTEHLLLLLHAVFDSNRPNDWIETPMTTRFLPRMIRVKYKSNRIKSSLFQRARKLNRIEENPHFSNLLENKRRTYYFLLFQSPIERNKEPSFTMHISSSFFAVVFNFCVLSPFIRAQSCATNCSDVVGTPGLDSSLYCSPTAIGEEICPPGMGACFDLKPAGCGSCLGISACLGTMVVGNNTCTGDEACYGANNADIGNDSCNAGWGRSCKELEYATVEDEACIWANACAFSGHVHIKKRACKGKKSCFRVGHKVVLGQGPVATTIVPITIGENACRGKRACCGIQENVPDNGCNGDFACCNSAAAGCTCQ